MRGSRTSTAAESGPTPTLVGGEVGVSAGTTPQDPPPDKGPQDPPPDKAGTVHVPPYQAGPSGGDSHTVTKANPKTGKITVLEHNTRQAAFVHCVGNGPMATLEVLHRVRKPVASVDIHYADADLTNAVVINATVTGSRSGWLGHGATLGQSLNEADPSDRDGTIHIPLHATPRGGETLRIQFGLQTHAGCLPYPVLGLPGSRTVESGRATFPWVSVG